MGEKILNVIVEGGKATAGPPLGPGLAPIGVNVSQVVAEINKATGAFPGLKVPVKIIVDTVSKGFRIEVGAPATSELVKKAAGIEKGSGTKDKVGNLELSAIAEMARSLKGKNQGKSTKEVAREIIGTCVSMGVTIDGKDAKLGEKEIKEGRRDSIFAG
ncbi:MAG: 50S ribosomal protein L11 [Candidatus ainarchaeum sp.]|nr:50S ribosomal protein L11 [Candidatus ainarchaeum sp.]